MFYELAEREAIMADSGINSLSAAFEDTEKWRAECEARHCLDYYSLEERREYLTLVQKHRGQEGRKYLEDAILKEWQKRKAA
jgi:hypothetical protein